MAVHPLPHEILASIFSQSSCHCTAVNEGDSNIDLIYRNTPCIAELTTLSLVCTQWRRVVVNHQQLWTHISLAVDASDAVGAYPRPNIWIERSHGAPLYINIRQYYASSGKRSLEDDEEVDLSFIGADLPSNSMVRRLRDFLVPLLPQVQGMSLNFYAPYDHLLNSLIRWWVTWSIQGRSKALRITSVEVLGNLSPRTLELFRDVPAASFYGSLETLHLHNTITSWPDIIFSSLVELIIRVDLHEWHVSQPRLRAIVSSTPQLEYLTLRGLKIKGPLLSNQLPVALTRLRALHIDGGFRSGSDLACILNLIDPGQNELHVYISISGAHEEEEQALPTIRSFMLRANVTTLHINGRFSGDHGYDPYFASQLGPLPRVKTLVLYHLPVSNSFKSQTIPPFSRSSRAGVLAPITYTTYKNPCPDVSHTTLWPDLQELYLKGCILEKTHLHRVISLHHIQKLYISDCRDHLTLERRTPVSSELLDEYMQLLMPVVTTVVVPEKGQGNWPYLMENLTRDLKCDFL